MRLIVILSIISLHNLYSQTPKIDSIRSIISKNKDNKELVSAYMQLGSELYPYGTDSAIYYWEKSSSLAEGLLKSVKPGSTEDTILSKTLATSLNNLGYQKALRADTVTALKMHRKAIEFFEHIGDRSGKSYAYHNLSLLYSRFGKYIEAKKYAELSLSERKAIDDKQGIAASYINIGQMYEKLGDAKKAFDFYSSALLIYEKNNHSSGIAQVYNNMGVLFDQQGDFDKCKFYHLKSLSIRDSIGDLRGKAYSVANLVSTYINYKAYDDAVKLALGIEELALKLNEPALCGQLMNNLGRAYFDLGEIDKAEKCYTEALLTLTKAGIKNGEVYTKINLSKLYLKKGILSEAVHNGEQALKLSQQLNLLDGVMKSSQVLTELYQKKSDWEKAFNSFEIYVKAKDSLLSIKNQRSAIEQETKYQYQKMAFNDSITTANSKLLIQLEIDKKNVELRTGRNLNIALSAIAALILLSLIYIYIAFQRKKKSESEIRKAKEVIEKQNKEKEILLKEIHHRVKNNLQILTGLLELQSAEMDDEKFSIAMLEGQNRVRSMALIHEKLYQVDQFSTIEMKSYISDLSREIQAAHSNRKNVEIEINSETIHLDIDSAIPIGLILNELLTNSWKYAFNDNSGKIQIKLIKSENEYLLDYSDSGQNFPENFDIKKAKSLGLRLIYRLSKQLFGSVTIGKNHLGTQFLIKFYDSDYRKKFD